MLAIVIFFLIMFVVFVRLGFIDNQNFDQINSLNLNNIEGKIHYKE
jgi:hypothetical protein